jgi:hypothetical protein
MRHAKTLFLRGECVQGGGMADRYLKALESERKSLWATCRLKGLAKDSRERQRIAELDRLLAEHAARPGAKPASGKGPGGAKQR